MHMKIDQYNLKYEFKFRDETDFPATMTLIIEEFMEIRNFTIRKSDYRNNELKFFLTPPSIRLKSNKYLSIFRLTEKNEWNRFQIKVIKEFEKQYDTHLFESLEGTSSTI